MSLAPGLKKFIKDNNVSIIKKNNKIEYLILYKVVTEKFGPWWLHDERKKHSGAYRPGTFVTCKDWDINRNNHCGKGLHVGTLNFCCISFAGPNRPYVIEVLVKPEDVVCVPLDTNGKIRCNKLLVTKLLCKYDCGLFRKMLPNGKWSTKLISYKSILSYCNPNSVVYI